MGETPVDAAIRESREEVGLNLLQDGLMLRAKILYEGENQRDNIHLFEYSFERIPSVTIDHKGVESFAWISKEEIGTYNILEPIFPYVQEALA
jgi:8-oxo-dGTP pyrophosphatase MutT (NUDIX family)